MANRKLSNLFIFFIVMLITIGIPYALYSIGTFVEIDYFGYINNWWIVLLFVLVLTTVFILGDVDIEKNLGNFCLMLFTIPFFLLGIQFGVKPMLDMESYGLLLEKEKEIDHLDSILLKLEKDLVQYDDQQVNEESTHSPDFKNNEIIFFDPGSAKLSDFSQSRIRSFISQLKHYKLNIKGYTDGSGTRASNMLISKERAQNVSEFIKSIDQGENAINEVVGYGDDDKLEESRNEIARSRNRRVTIEVAGRVNTNDNAGRKRILDNIDQYRGDLNEAKSERDRLRGIVFRSVEE